MHRLRAGHESKPAPCQQRARAALAKPKTQAITVNNEGKIFLNTTPVTLQELTQKLTEAKAATPDLPVVIRGDSQTQYQAIMDVLAVVGNLGITQVGLATKPGK